MHTPHHSMFPSANLPPYCPSSQDYILHMLYATWLFKVDGQGPTGALSTDCRSRPASMHVHCESTSGNGPSKKQARILSISVLTMKELPCDHIYAQAAREVWVESLGNGEPLEPPQSQLFQSPPTRLFRTCCCTIPALTEPSSWGFAGTWPFGLLYIVSAQFL